MDDETIGIVVIRVTRRSALFVARNDLLFYFLFVDVSDKNRRRKKKNPLLFMY